MKKLSILLVIIVPFIFAMTSNLGGSPGGYSSSSGDGGSCNVCHAGSNNFVSGWLTSNIPTSGYITGQTYIITVTGTHSGVNKFGFEATSEDALWNKVGEIIITNFGKTKLINSNTAVTHTGNGATPNGNNKSWSFNWKAPSIGTGAVTFSAALCACNGNMSTTGDKTYTTKLIVNEDINNSLGEISLSSKVTVSHSIADNVIIVKWNDVAVSNLRIHNIQGKVVYEKDMSAYKSNRREEKISISHLITGMYFIRVQSEKGIFIKKFIRY